jgi:hypothetical protein
VFLDPANRNAWVALNRQQAPCGGRKPFGFSSLYNRKISHGQAEHRNAAAVLEINGGAINGEPFGGAQRRRIAALGLPETMPDW